MDNTEIKDLLLSLPNKSYKRHLSDVPVTLTSEIASALGTSQRQLSRVLEAVIEAIAAKLFVQSVTLSDPNSDTAVKEWLTDWELLERQLWKAAVRDGTTYALVGYEQTPVIHQLDTYDGRTGAVIVYADVNKRRALYGLNTWHVGKTSYLDLYYPERIEKYVIVDGIWEKRKDSKDEQWPIDWTDNQGQPLGIALVKLSIGESDLAGGAVQTQTDINNALLDQIAVSRTMGFPQRYLKGSNSSQYLTNSYGQPFLNSVGIPISRTIKLTPGSIMPVQQDEELGQLSQASIDTTLIDKLLHLLSLQTTVPTFYFTGDFPSGVALIQAETRLNGKAEEHQGYLTTGLLDLIRLMLRLSNTFGSTQFDTETQIDIVWYPPQIEDETVRRERQDSVAKNVTLLMGAGVLSLETAVTMLHPDWDEQQIAAEVNRISAEKSIIAL